MTVPSAWNMGDTSPLSPWWIHHCTTHMISRAVTTGHVHGGQKQIWQLRSEDVALSRKSSPTKGVVGQVSTRRRRIGLVIVVDTPWFIRRVSHMFDQGRIPHCRHSRQQNMIDKPVHNERRYTGRWLKYFLHYTLTHRALPPKIHGRAPAPTPALFNLSLATWVETIASCVV